MKKKIDSIKPLLVIEETNRALQRIKPVIGDVRKVDFGLSKEELYKIAFQTNYIFHCAAVIQFNLSLEEARFNNVNGTNDDMDLNINLPQEKDTCRLLLEREFSET